MFPAKPPYVSMFGPSPFRAAEICKNNRVVSPFLRLPAELRNKIYDYAMQTPGGVVVIVCRHNGRFYLATPFGATSLWDSDIEVPTWHPLNQASRQLRAETMILQFTINTFELEIGGLEGVVALLPRFALDAITVLRIRCRWSGEGEQRDDRNGCIKLRCLGQLPNLKRIVLLQWQSGPCRVDRSEEWRLKMKEAIMAATGQDVEVV